MLRHSVYVYTHAHSTRIRLAHAWRMRTVEPPIYQARVPERVACCTLCSKLWSQTIIPPDEVSSKQ